MAANILKQSRVVCYFPSLRAVVKHINRPLGNSIATASNMHQSPHVYGTPDLGPFATKDPRFPLPGDMNLDVGLDQTQEFQVLPNQKSLASAFLEVETTEVNKHHTLATFLNNTEKDEKMKQKMDTLNNTKGDVECSVQQCNTSLQRSFSELFPDVALKQGGLTVVSVCQHTTNDMTSWSQAVQAEREVLLENFIESAKQICESLQSQGYWADFIDPSCGTAHFGAHTNATFFEVDERYNQLGYRVMDLGCCKALSHHLWGTFIYVGSIFTDAPVDSSPLQAALSNK